MTAPMTAPRGVLPVASWGALSGAPGGGRRRTRQAPECRTLAGPARRHPGAADRWRRAREDAREDARKEEA